jgi:ribosomal protein S12 methylthiotransferase accessory factor
VRGTRAAIRLENRPIRHRENGLRVVPPAETLERVERMVLSLPFEVRFGRTRVVGSPFERHLVQLVVPGRGGVEGTYFGKGLSAEQCTISASLELVERWCARRLDDEGCFVAGYRDVSPRACDPVRLILPSDTCYREDLPIEWVSGTSLTQRRPILVPANLVFLPYRAPDPGSQIADCDSNGLAAGNCIEEAILHGLLEVIERDVRVVMEYNRLNMPDLILDAPIGEPLRHYLASLEASGIQARIKDVTNDIPVPSIGVFLSGEYRGEPTCSYAVGTDLSPEVALSRAVTEAVQAYPRSGNYEEWIDSGPIAHLREPSERAVPFSSLPDLARGGIAECIGRCVELLEELGCEVIVVDLTRPETGFATVRVCVTDLQPLVMVRGPRLSRRLFEVPGRLGFAPSGLTPETFAPRVLCGMRAT